MDLMFSLSAAPSITTNNLVVAAYNTTALGTVAGSQVINPPHTSWVNVLIPNLAKGTYYVKVYSTSGTSPGGTLVLQFWYSPVMRNAKLRADLFITADVTPGFASGQLAYVDASLVGWDYSVENLGAGTMDPANDYTQNPAGGWALNDPANLIQPSQRFCIHFVPQLTIIDDTTGSQALQFADQVIVQSDQTLTNSIIGKAVVIQGIGQTNLTITWPDPSTVTDMILTLIQSDGGVHTNATVVFGPNAQVLWNGQLSDRLILGQRESVMVYKKIPPGGGTPTYFVFGPTDGGWSRVGELFESYTKTGYVNAIPADGRILNRSDYPRLWAWVQTLDASMLVSESAWITPDGTTGLYIRQGCWSTGDGTTTFGVPNLNNGPAARFTNAIGVGFTRGVDGSTRKAATYQIGRVANFLSNIIGTVLKKSGDATAITVLSNLPSNNEPTYNPAPTLSKFFSPQEPTGSLLNVNAPGGPNGRDDKGNPVPGAEHRPDNVGVYKMFRI